MAETATASWVTRQHPRFSLYREEEARQRASFVATRRALAPFLVPHRFEGNVDPETLRRARLGYGIGLNRAWSQDIFGHVRAAPARRHWGPLEEGEEKNSADVQPPASGIAKDLWDDATRDGTSWENFFLRKVLEWMLTSPGGVIVVDTPSLMGADGKPRARPTLAEQRHKGLRPYVRFVRASMVEDFELGEFGLQWVKLLERGGARGARAENGAAPKKVRVLYELRGQDTFLSRWNDEGQQIGEEIPLGTIVDPQGQPMLPVIPATFGEHPDVELWGSGLLLDLADIVIDLFNVHSETREGFRDAAFGVMKYRGSDGEKVQNFLEAGSRYIDLGDSERAELERLAGTVEEVVQGLALMDAGLKAWNVAARRKAAEAMTTSAPRSGISLAAEFQLDLVPLLREVAGQLDQIETNVMFVAAQLAGATVEQLEEVAVVRAKNFRPEEETARISRILTDFRATGLPLPAEVSAEAVMAWLDSVDFIDLDREVVTAEGAKVTFRELARLKVEDALRQVDTQRRNAATFFGDGEMPPFPGASA